MAGRPPQWGQAAQYGAGYYQQAPGAHPQQWAGYQQQQPQWTQQQQQQQLPAGAPPPPPPPEPGAAPPAGVATNVASGAAAGYSQQDEQQQQQQQQQQQWQQWQQQQQGYGGYGGAYYGQQGGWQQPQAGWQQQSGWTQQQGGWTQQQAAAYAQHGYDGYASTAAAAAPPLPSQPPAPDTTMQQPDQQQARQQQQPAWKAAADRVAAGAARRDAGSVDGYNAVPPPSNLAQPAGGHAAAAGRRTFSIRPQMPNQQRPSPPTNTLVAAFHQAASKIGTGATAAPAYTAVQLPAQHRQQQQHAAAAQPAAVSPQQWPPALKAYVERAFKTADVRQRPKLQDVLKHVIGDAQNSGELWTRDWEAMPLPDLSQTAADAAAVLSEVAAVSGPAAAVGGAAGAPGAARASRWAAPSPQQQYAAQQYYAAQQQQQQHAAGNRQTKYGKQQQQQQQQGKYGRSAQRQRLDTGEERHGRRGRKRGYRSDSSRSSDSEEDGWSYAERQRRQRRAGRFGDSSSRHGGGSSWSAEERRQRVLAMLEEGDDEDVDWEALTIKGTSQDLEKSYFRLTSAPDPATVRPEPVLRRALERLVELLRNGGVNYFYALDQFKGMRQDCTVQHIRNDLAVQVYEAHARAALEYGDVAEYNQCQSQLRTLYNEGTPGSRTEFLAYRIIYQAVHAKHGEILQLLNTLKKVKPEEAAQPAVAHALRVRAALAAADYPAFYRLYAAAPALGRALMDIYVPTLRFDALNIVVKAFKPSVPVPFLAGLLGFVPRAAGQAGKSDGGGQVSERADEAGADAGSDAGGAVPADGPPEPSSGNGAAAAAGAAAPARDGSGGEPLPGCMQAYFVGEHAAQADMERGCLNCIAWLAECGAEVTGGSGPPAEAALDCKASVGQLKMPEEKAKVAHGDENLRLEDFLKTFS